MKTVIVNNKPRVSVIIVNWNGKKWLKKCIESLQVQTYKDIEIIIVDNASSDASAEYIETVFPVVRLIKSPTNLGFAGGNNLGIAAAAGEYIMLVNNDTWSPESLVEDLLAELEREQLDIIGPRATRYSGPSELTAFVGLLDVLGHPVFEPYGVKVEPFYLSGVCLLFKKSLYEQTLGMDSDFFMYVEEVDWFWRLHLLGKHIKLSDSSFIHHEGQGSTGRQGGIGGINQSRFLWRNENKLQMLLKNYRASTLCFVLPALFLKSSIEAVCFCIMLKPGLAWTYFQGWWFNVRHLRRTLRKRRWVQANRIKSDYEIMKGMYKGIGEIRHLKLYFVISRSA